jgi:flagellar motility protein MotE (MotC chaperone)
MLQRPRLLPATIIAMSALLAVKSVSLLQAVAAEIAPAAADSAVRAGAPASGLPGPAAAAAQAAPVGAAQPPAEPPISAAERQLLLDLRHRREMLDARARAQDQRDAELDAADRRLSERVRELSSLQARLEALEAGRQSHSAENWAGLVKIYEAMKPRDAAAIFDALDMQVLLQVLDRMQARRVAPVLAAMQPDRARLATQLLAEMRIRATTPAAAGSGTTPSPDPKN